MQIEDGVTSLMLYQKFLLLGYEDINHRTYFHSFVSMNIDLCNDIC